MKNIRPPKNFFSGKIRAMGLNSKLSLFYFFFFLLSTLISSNIYIHLNTEIVLSQALELSAQHLASMESSICTIIETANNCSKMILSSDIVQQGMRENSVYNSRKIDLYLNDFLGLNPIVSSVYLIDNTGYVHCADTVSRQVLTVPSITQAPWYKEAQQQNGRYIIKLNAGNVLSGTSDTPYVSLIRMLRDLNTGETLGVEIVNISAGALQSSLAKEQTSQYSYAVFSENGQCILTSPSSGGEEWKTLLYENEPFSRVTEIEGKKYLAAQTQIETLKWGIGNLISLNDLTAESARIRHVALGVLFLDGIILLVGSILISKMVVSPLNKLQKAMIKTQKGEFKKLEIETHGDEIGQIKDVYNSMLEKIQELLERISIEQRIKREAELKALQAQIKPHFLYNALDSMGALALAGRTEELYEMIEALGNYYRTCLSSGPEITTIRAEVAVTQDYMRIQKIRFKDKLCVYYDIDAAVMDYPIPKLILQPLVENALCHGVLPKSSPGSIIISIHLADNYLTLVVEDDGVGMDENTLQALARNVSEQGSRRFGLRGTLERLQIFFNQTNICNVQSELGKGTKVTIKIDLRQRKLYE